MRLFTVLFFLLIFSSAHAVMDMGIAIGYRSNDGSSTSSGTSIDGESGLTLGGTAYIPLGEMFDLRTGFLYTQRYYTSKTGSMNTDIELAYVDIPLTAMYKLSDIGGIFAGIAVGLKASDKCGNGDCTDVKSTITPLQLGGFFKIGPQIAIEVFYESLSAEIVSGLEDTTAVGANLVITLE